MKTLYHIIRPDGETAAIILGIIEIAFSAMALHKMVASDLNN